ncbi:MAG: hypothetical protein HQL03_09530 [Nitrospirae bacterium]|nr:hypothetical protein [Nitrospirota bacterium]MBF0592602.1 hypothetical protein [Nitrospirota bacterium]
MVLLWWFVAFMWLLVDAVAEEDKQMWPKLKQPWYFSKPYGVAADGSGNVYVADTDNHRIEKFTPDGRFVAAWGSKGSEEGQFERPRGIAVDSNDNVYVLDWGNVRLQKFTSDGNFIATWDRYVNWGEQFKSPDVSW